MSATITNCLDDTSVANHLVPASDTQLAIVCDDAGTCVNTVDATLDTPDGVRACIVVSGQGHTIQGDSAVAVQTAASRLTPANTCSPIPNDPDMEIATTAAVFSDPLAQEVWTGRRGSYFAFSFCQDRGSSTVICRGATGITGNVGEVQFCGGTCVMVYLGSQDDASCGTDQERRFYESVCKDKNNDYDIYQLAFMDFEVRYVAVINGTAWNLWEEQPAGTVLSLSAAFENPFTSYQMARQGRDYAGAHVSPEPIDRTNCNGYCGFANRTEDDVRMTMYGNCVTPSDGCASTSGSSTCTGTVQFFDQSRAGSALPATVSGAILRYNGTNYIVQFTASAIPLKGRVEFSVPNAERVLPSEAATNVNGIMTALLPQDADHEDVVVVYTDGAVATASRDCAFTLLETRDKNRMYSMRNVRNVTECDLLLSNGASERSLSVAAQTTKNSGAVPVANATALWPVNPPGSESRSSGLSKGAKIGIGVGVPVGVIVIACTIVLIVYRCCRKKKEVSPLSSEEVVEPEEAEPPKEGNPLVHPVANTEDSPTPTNAAAETQSSVEPVAREAVAAPVESVAEEAATPPVQYVRSVFPSAPIPEVLSARRRYDEALQAGQNPSTSELEAVYRKYANSALATEPIPAPTTEAAVAQPVQNAAPPSTEPRAMPIPAAPVAQPVLREVPRKAKPSTKPNHVAVTAGLGRGTVPANAEPSTKPFPAAVTAGLGRGTVPANAEPNTKPFPATVTAGLGRDTVPANAEPRAKPAQVGPPKASQAVPKQQVPAPSVAMRPLRWPKAPPAPKSNSLVPPAPPLEAQRGARNEETSSAMEPAASNGAPAQVSADTGGGVVEPSLPAGGPVFPASPPNGGGGGPREEITSSDAAAEQANGVAGDGAQPRSVGVVLQQPRAGHTGAASSSASPGGKAEAVAPATQRRVSEAGRNAVNAVPSARGEERRSSDSYSVDETRPRQPAAVGSGARALEHHDSGTRSARLNSMASSDLFAHGPLSFVSHVDGPSPLGEDWEDDSQDRVVSFWSNGEDVWEQQAEAPQELPTRNNVGAGAGAVTTAPAVVTGDTGVPATASGDGGVEFPDNPMSLASAFNLAELPDETNSISTQPHYRLSADFRNESMFGPRDDVVVTREGLRPPVEILPFDSTMQLYVHIHGSVPELFVRVRCQIPVDHVTVMREVGTTLERFLAMPRHMSKAQLEMLHRFVEVCARPSLLSFYDGEEANTIRSPSIFINRQGRHNICISAREHVQ